MLLAIRSQFSDDTLMGYENLFLNFFPGTTFNSKAILHL